MTRRWLAPVCALLALGFGSLTLHAKGGDLKVQFSTEPDKVAGNLSDLDVRPNTDRPFYLFITNNSGNDRDATIQLTDSLGKTVFAEAKLKLAEKTPIRITFAKPAPMPPAGGVVPAAASAAPPMPMVPPPPPGVELKGAYVPAKSNVDFGFKVRIFDDRDKQNPSEDIAWQVNIPYPTTYVKPVEKNSTYSNQRDTNQLTIEMQTDGLIGAAPCPVELSFPPQQGLKSDALREGVYKRSLNSETKSVRLYSKNLPLVSDKIGKSSSQEDLTETVYISVDGVPRSYVFRPKLHTETGPTGTTVDQQTKSEIRYMEAAKNRAAETIYVRPGIIPIRVEADVAPLGAAIQLKMKRISEEEVVQNVSRDVVREQRVWLEPAGADGSVLVTTKVGDWVIPLDVRDYRGRYELRAILFDPKEKDKSKFHADFTRTFVVDDTKPEEVSVMALPDRDKNVDPPRHIRTLPLPVKVTASDPESKIVKVVVFLGKPGPDGKLPEGAVEATQPDEKNKPSTWLAQVPLPMGVKGEQELTAVATNAVGLSESGTQKIQLLDPPTGGTIRGTVALSKGGKPLPDVAVVLRDSEGKEKASAKTNDKGIFEMKEVPPGAYKLLAARPDSGVGTKAIESVTVKAGETSTVRMVLNRKP